MPEQTVRRVRNDPSPEWLNAGYRLCAEPYGIGKADSRIRGAADFEQFRYLPLVDGQDPLPREGAYRCRCVGGPYGGRKFRSPTAPLTIGFRLAGQVIAGDSYTHEAVYERADRQRGVWVYVSTRRKPGDSD